MRNQLSKSIFVLVLIGFMSSFEVQACPESLRNLKSQVQSDFDFCQVADRYTVAIQTLQWRGVHDPLRLADLLAPRFINGPTWEEVKVQKNFNPWMIYSPAPLTWQGWEAGNKMIQDQVTLKLQHQQISPLRLEWLFELHRATMAGLLQQAGQLRDHQELGLSLDRGSAPLLEESQKISAGPAYQSHQSQRSLIRWHATNCYEDLSSENRALSDQFSLKHAHFINLSYWPEISADQFFVDSAGRKRQCGYIEYAQTQDVSPELSEWLKDLNESMEHPGENDPLVVAAHAQKLFISIHPFLKGNGRISRFVMDLYLESIGLPTAILPDMDDDIYSTETEWAQKIAKGILRTLQTLETCAQSSPVGGCRPVPLSPEGLK